MAKAKLHSVKSRLITLEMTFKDNDQALQVFGPAEKNLKHIQKQLPVQINSRGNELVIQGENQAVKIAEKCLLYLKDRLVSGKTASSNDLNDSLKLFQNNNAIDIKSILQRKMITFPKKDIYPRSHGQLKYIETIQSHDIVLGIGPAGTGKTYLAVAVGMAKLLRSEVDRIILTRPAVEAGERLGYLPGDLVEKVNPYLRPLYDSLHDMIDNEKAARMIASGQIEIAPIAFMRGRTLNNSYAILDEAQNCTREQMKMFLTRLGDNCQAVITGDITQSDLPKGTKSGLIQAIRILKKIDGIGMHQFDETDVVRHPLVAEIVKAYEKAKKIP